MRIAIYARTSTSNGRQDTENQLQPLKEWASRLGGEIVEIYVDEASGAKNDRAALNKLLEDAHLRKFDTLLVWALDRISRQGIAKMSEYLERLKHCDVRLLSHQESWLNAGGQISELLVAIFGWIAQQERLRIRERVLAGLKTTKKKLGRPTRQVDIQKAETFRSQGYSIREIAQFVGVPRATLARALSQKPQVVAA